ncbi:MAG: phenylalanine--tRNA ligase subunit alpha [Candidatus Aenigmarchaeota archaeon]|nr:phenylalanine--tRNA ligase subunit alpha [Candidatus Aenigmarchaeota archaeon]
MTMYSLTPEGKKYLKEGFPEMNLLRELKKEKEISKLKKRIENFDIAIMWAKKNGWIKIDKGKLILENFPEKYDLSDALKKVDDGKEVDKNYIEILMKRNLVKEMREDIEKRAMEFVGKEITTLDPSLLKTGLWRKVSFKKYNVTVPGKRLYIGKIHPYQKFIMKVRRKLIELGFKEMTGPLIELEFWNFDALFQPQNHPARDWTDTYSLKNPKYGDLPDRKLVEAVKKSHEENWKYKWSEEKARRLMPRAHDTAISPRYLSKGIEIPGKYFSLVRCFRPDVMDENHLIEFNQLGGFVIGEDMNLRKLLGLLKMFALEFGNAKEVKFYPDYYPFTEPSVQLSIKNNEGKWIELAGAGIFRRELTEPLGIDIPVIAWGIGLDRLAMSALGIKDIRKLFSYDLSWLRDQKVL